MRSIRNACVVAMAFFAVSSYADIQLMLAGGNPLFEGPAGCAVDTTVCCTSYGGAQYRYTGMKCVRDTIYDVMYGSVCKIDYSKGSYPFMEAFEPSAETEAPHLIYGRADKFIVPETGTYKLRISFEQFAFLIIDGELVRMLLLDENGDLTERGFPLWPGDMMGTPDTALGEQFGTYTAFTDVELDAGDHTLEFFYSPGPNNYHHEALFRLSWMKPGESNFEIIPASAFAPSDDCSFSSVRKGIASASGRMGVISIAGNTLTVGGAVSDVNQIAIYGASGRRVSLHRLQKGVKNAGIDLSGLTSGVYVAKALRGNTVVATERFVRK
ncbi:MAG: T9SS type A sorting domain-containing protein [Chitinivibrionales bacterium]|nr:T9SS type A sorting domain-containing protein [Chitinivibrionales bacterium]MBD3358148.1 T9SS type A sorting domain-containing protein [Chitinivibrionales bacterium]